MKTASVCRKIARNKMPDVIARLKKVFGWKMISNQMMKEILYGSRTDGENMKGAAPTAL